MGERAVVAEDDVAHRLREPFREARDVLDRAAHAEVAEGDLALQAAVVGQVDRRGRVGGIGLELADVVQQRTGDRHVAIDAGERRADRPDRLRDSQRVLEEAVAVGLVEELGCGRGAVGRPRRAVGAEEALEQLAQVRVADGVEELAQVDLHLVGRARRPVDEVGGIEGAGPGGAQRADDDLRAVAGVGGEAADDPQGDPWAAQLPELVDAVPDHRGHARAAIGQDEVQELAAVALLARLDLPHEEDLVDVESIVELTHQHGQESSPERGRDTSRGARLRHPLGSPWMAEREDRWWTLGAVCVAIFMLLVDIGIVNVALPDMARDLHSGFEDLQWVIDAYTLSLAALLLTAGSLADRLGRKRLFVGGLVVFTAASALCGLATSPLFLDVARALQGTGGAAMWATSLALVAAAFPPAERGRAFGIVGATIGAAIGIAPVAGGLLTQHIGWQAIFFVNVPIGAVALAITIRRVSESRDENAGRIDLPGFVTFTGGLFALVFGLVRGNPEGWTSTTVVASLVLAAVLLGAFVVRELTTAAPMIDLSLLRNRSYAGASIVAFTQGASIFALFLYITLYLQNTLGNSPQAAGAELLPLTLLNFSGAAIAGRAAGRITPRALLVVGMGLTALGLFLMSIVDAGSSWTALLPGLMLGGFGIGLVNPPLVETSVATVPSERSGVASGMARTFTQTGVAFGIAGWGALLAHLLTTKLPGGAPGTVLAQGSPAAAGAHTPERVHAYLAAYTSGLGELFVIAGGVAVVGMLAALVLVNRQDFEHLRDPQPQPAQ